MFKRLRISCLCVKKLKVLIVKKNALRSNQWFQRYKTKIKCSNGYKNDLYMLHRLARRFFILEEIGFRALSAYIFPYKSIQFAYKVKNVGFKKFTKLLNCPNLINQNVRKLVVYSICKKICDLKKILVNLF